MMYASICHSDENYLTGVRPWKINSVIGHEGAGIVESVGDGITAFKAGMFSFFSMVFYLW